MGFMLLMGLVDYLQSEIIGREILYLIINQFPVKYLGIACSSSIASYILLKTVLFLNMVILTTVTDL